MDKRLTHIQFCGILSIDTNLRERKTKSEGVMYGVAKNHCMLTLYVQFEPKLVTAMLAGLKQITTAYYILFVESARSQTLHR